MIMDGNWSGAQFETFVNATAQFPDFVHPPSRDNDPAAGINVGFISGHVEFRKRSEVPTSESDVFWSGIPSD
jgi:hypothetical protein